MILFEYYNIYDLTCSSFDIIVFLFCRYIKRGKPDAGFALFESESLKWPGFVEFDDVNGKVLTYSAADRYIDSILSRILVL